MHSLKETLEVSQLSLCPSSDVIAKKGFLFQISQKGFYLRLNRKHLSKELKYQLSLNSIHNKIVGLSLPQINFHLDGKIIETRYIGKGIFELFIQFLDDVPEYWTRCLTDMIMSYPEGELADQFQSFCPAKKI